MFEKVWISTIAYLETVGYPQTYVWRQFGYPRLRTNGFSQIRV